MTGEIKALVARCRAAHDASSEVNAEAVAELVGKAEKKASLIERKLRESTTKGYAFERCRAVRQARDAMAALRKLANKAEEIAHARQVELFQ